MPTKSETTANDIAALLRARNSLIYVITNEEARVEGYLAQAAGKAGYIPRFWDSAAGVTGLDGKPEPVGGPSPDATLAEIEARSTGRSNASGERRGVWIMRDLNKWVGNDGIGVQPQRQLRNLARTLSRTPRETAQAIIVLTPSSDIPPELQGHATVVEWPSPDRDEVAGILDALVKAYDLNLNGARDAAIDAAVGLSGAEVQAVYSKSLVQTKTIDPAIVSREKKRVIAKSGVLEWLDTLKGGLSAVGGLDGVKTWVTKRSVAFTPAARAYGLPALKGLLLCGISGCGKTYIAKALGGEWKCPLVKLDFGALKGKFVGESEGRLRKALATIDSLGPCIVLVDEIEKGLAGATQGAADGGVSADALGTFLSWMNDRTSEAFVIATANDITSIVNNAPELLRKGRFDEIFWVDLPTTPERGQILFATLQAFKRDPNSVDLGAVADVTDKFNGAELASLVPEALFTAFADGERAITTEDLIAAAKSVVALSETAKDKIASMRSWAAGKAKPATTPVAVSKGETAKVLDL